MMTKISNWDASEHLDNPEIIAAYMEAALEDGDPALISAALGDIAKAKGMTTIARETGLSRESLYRTLSKNGKPELSTFLKVVKALGLQLSLKPMKRKSVKKASRTLSKP